MAFEGQNLGIARGRIEIDTSPLSKAVKEAARFGKELDGALNKGKKGAQETQSRFQRLSGTIKSLRGEFMALGLAAGALVGIGVNAAANLESATIKLKGLAGGMEEAAKLMEDLRNQAREAALPFGDMLQVAGQLLPTLEGNTQELQKYLDLVQRIAVNNPQQGLAGAGFALNELLSSGGTDIVSLAERFNIPKQALRAALKENAGDLAAALDQVLTKMGLTSDVAKEMGKSFTRSLGLASDAFQQLLGAALTPFIEQMTPILQQGAEWLTQLRETNPELVKTGGNIALITVGLTGLSVVAAKLVTIFQTLGGVAAFKWLAAIIGGLGGAGIATAAVTGGVAVAGGAVVAGAGALAMKGAGALGDERAANFGLEDIVPTLKNMATTFEFYNQKIIAATTRGSARDNALRRAGVASGGFHTSSGQQATETNMFLSRAGAISGKATADAVDPLKPSDDVMMKWAASVQSIEESANASRLAETQSFESSRADTIRSFNKTLSRDAEDWGRSQARSLKNHQRSMADARDDIADRDADNLENFNERIAEIREDAAERFVDIEKRSSEQREDLAAGHKDNILKAASRLDARAIQEENRRFATALKKIDRQEKRAKKKTADGTDERLADEKKAFDKRNAKAKEADEERLIEMEAAFQEARAQQAEDREIRLARQKEDHDDQLQAQADAHAKRMIQIAENEVKETDAANAAFEEALAKEGITTQNWIAEHQKRLDAAKEAFDAWYDHIEARFAAGGAPTGGDAGSGGDTKLPDDPIAPTPFARGGPVHGTGKALLHSGEYVLNAKTTRSLNAMMGGGLNQSNLLGAASGGGGNSNVSVTMGEGTIVVNESERPGETAAEIEEMLIQAFRSIA